MPLDSSRLIDLFTRLVSINSPSGSERAIADFLKARLNELGLEVTEDDAAKKAGGNAGNLLAVLPGNAPGNPVLLCAHMDTVQSTEGLKPVVDNGWIRTDGKTILGADDKAGVAAILWALGEVRQRSLSNTGVEVLLTVQEETGSLGCRAFDIHRLKSREGFVLDSGGPPGQVVGVTPSQVGVFVTVKGRAAHAGVEPEKGVNAIWVASRALARLPVGRIDDETTLNVGVIRGGSAPNMVPDTIEIRGEARGMDPSKLNEILARVEQTFHETAESAGATAEVKRSKGFTQYRVSENDPVVRCAFSALRREGLSPRLVPRGGGSDANVLNEAGLMTVNLAVGIQDDHSVNEKIAVSDLEKAARFTLNLITGGSPKH